MFRKQFCVALASAVALSFGFAGAASAQQYPDKPIKLIVPYPPGATNDLLARVLAEPLAKELGLADGLRSVGFITCSSDDALYVALDEGTKAAEVERTRRPVDERSPTQAAE